MDNELNPAGKLNFLIGKWRLIYDVPESIFSKKDKGEGTGEFKYILNTKFVSFDYSSELNSGRSSAHGIFGWDEKINAYRYWWFEDSGSFQTATCNFIGDDTLYMNWNDTLLVQSFKKESSEKVILEMRYPSSKSGYNVILKVEMTKL